MASVAKWLTHPIVTRASAGSNPVARPIPIKGSNWIRQAVKASIFTPSNDVIVKVKYNCKPKSRSPCCCLTHWGQVPRQNQTK